MGSFSVLNNLPAVNGINQLNLNNVNLNRTLNRMASGKRINTGADDAAGLQIADQLRGNVMAINQAIRNAGDGISVLQIADAALAQVTTMLWRSITLMEEAATGTMDSDAMKALNNEYGKLQSEISRIYDATNFNGKELVNGACSSLGIFVGDLKNTGSYIYVEISSLNSAVSNLSGYTNGAATKGLTQDDVTKANNTIAGKELGKLKSALNNVANIRGNIGASMNRLQAAIDVLAVTSQNTLSAEDTIRSANMAEEISNMTKFQIIAQTGIAALAQANANSQNVLGLLR